MPTTQSVPEATPSKPVGDRPPNDQPWPAPSGRGASLLCWRAAAFCGVTLYLASLAALIVVLRFWGDATWWTVALVFGPRWMVSIPLLALLPWSLLSFRRRLPALFAAVVLNGLLLDIEFGRLSGAAAPDSDRRLRIVTCNIQGSLADLTRFADFARQNSADIIILQETPAGAALDPCWPTNWHRREAYGFAVLSRFPILAAEPMSVTGVPRPLALKCTLSTPAGDLQICDVHLSTPRDALDAILAGKWAGAPAARDNIARRDRESKSLSDLLAAASSSVIVAGDFNLTADSRIYRDHWSRFRNAFSDAGWGLGYTKYTRRFGVRIDHVLSNSAWQAAACEVGPAIGSDHRPLLADMELHRP